jgi:hypothetical protein
LNDELNRVVKSTYHEPAKANKYLFNSVSAYNETFTYDANGNLKTLRRADVMGNVLDNFNYGYDALKKNRLLQVSEPPGTSSAGNDIPVGIHNYTYDNIGNLKTDVTEGLAVSWNGLGKVEKVVKSNASGAAQKVLAYYYDGGGNRVMATNIKRLVATGNLENAELYDLYIRDASGNILGTQQLKVQFINTTTFSITLSAIDNHIYGSGRLGTYSASSIPIINEQLPNFYNALNTYTYPDVKSVESGRMYSSRRIGYKSYELADYLGNVHVTFSDYKRSTQTVVAGKFVFKDFTIGKPLSVQNYYAFGMLKMGTALHSSNADKYRFGFNTQEKVNEISGVGNHNTALFWEYDTRLGRRWNLDPVDQISISNYAVMFNNPILFNDVLGDYSRVGAWWRNIRDGGSGIKKSKETGEWGYLTQEALKDDRIGVKSILHDGLRKEERDQLRATYPARAEAKKREEEFQVWVENEQLANTEDLVFGKSYSERQYFHQHQPDWITDEMLVMTPKDRINAILGMIPLGGGNASLAMAKVPIIPIITSGWVKKAVFKSLDPAIQKKVAAAIEKGIVAPTGQQGIIKLTASEAASTGYLYKIKILGKGGDIRIYGNPLDNGHILFDKIMGH